MIPYSFYPTPGNAEKNESAGKSLAGSLRHNLARCIRKSMPSMCETFADWQPNGIPASLLPAKSSKNILTRWLSHKAAPQLCLPENSGASWLRQR